MLPEVGQGQSEGSSNEEDARGLLDEMGPTSVTLDTSAVVAAVAMLLLNKDKCSNSHVTESCSLQIFFFYSPT